LLFVLVVLVVCPFPQNVFLLSSRIVTGPSFTRLTCIIA
jgi:hypothetical protein